MTIGPEPMTQIERRSGLRGMPHLPDEGLEQRPRVVRTGRRLWVELHRAGALRGQLEPLHRAVVERLVRDVAAVARLHREAVVLARDEHPAGRTLEHRMVGAAVAEREL